jgi:putative endonuclease
MTSELTKRIFEHKNKLAEGFTKRHNIAILVHYEVFGDPVSAIHREKCLKEWRREWKIRLIEEKNPDWKDLYQEVTA